MKMLADLLIANPVMRLAKGRTIDSAALAKAARRAERYLLDERTTRMIVRVSNNHPAFMRKLMDLAWPAAEDVWIEFPSHAMLDERAKLHMNSFDYVLRTPKAHTAALISTSGDVMHINCIEHDETCHGIFPWLLGFKVFKERQDQPMDECLAVWGYTPEAKHPEILQGYALPSVHPDTMNDVTGMEEIRGILLKELAGFVRLTLVALALLSSPATRKGPPTRPRGRFVAHGGTHPYHPRQFVELALPKTVRDAQAYVERTLATHHKRLHEVRSHYRHLLYRPNAPGWEPIEIEGEKLWRKAIAKHLRGNPDLGVVEHVGVHVKGPSQ